MLHLQNGTHGLKQNTQHSVLKRKKKQFLPTASMVSKLSVLQVIQIMTEDDFVYLTEYEPDTVKSLCSALSIELQEQKENLSVEKPN
jgi:hypothetical protein